MGASQEEIRRQIEKLLEMLGVNASIATEDRDGQLFFNIRSADSHLLIGQHGQNLKSLQHIARLLARNLTTEPKVNSDTPNFSIDVEDYRRERSEFLEALARKAASRVRETKQLLILKPMNSYDRKMIHSYLASAQDLATESVGEEPERRVVIRLRS